MRYSTLWLGMHIACCLYIAAIAWWRSCKTSKCTTKPVVLWRLHVVNLVGVLGLIPLLVPSWEPEPVASMLLLAFACSESLTIPFWRAGAPDPDAQTVPGQLQPPSDAIGSH